MRVAKYLSIQPLAVLDVKGNAKLRRTLEVREGLQERRELTVEEAPEILERLAKSTSLETEQRAILRKALARLRRRKDVTKAAVELAERIDDLDDERDRLRADLRALGRDTDAHEELADKVLALEKKRDRLRAEQEKKNEEAASLEERAFRSLKALKGPKTP